jgi:superfamily II DNA or RNA helicase
VAWWDLNGSEGFLTLRPYQEEAVAGVLRSWQDFDRALGVAPTAAGKTVIFAKIIEARLDNGPCLVLAHRDELLQQAREKLHAACGLRSQLEKAESYADLDAKVVVGSVQTLSRRVERFPANHFPTVIVDEAHRTLADSYLKVLGRFSQAKVLGVTATPDRGDKKTLGSFYQDISFEIGLIPLILAGYLARIRVQTVPLRIDLSRVKTRGGDYAEEDIGGALEPLLEQIADELTVHAPGRKTLVFAPLVRTSEQFAGILRSRGFAAEMICGDSRDRAEILARFKTGKTQVLVNAMLLTEGYDEPSIDCVLVLRPTKVRSLFAQMVGRGTRTFPGKADLLLLDFLWLTNRHDLVKPANLIAENEEEANRITKAIAEGSDDLIGAQAKAQRDHSEMLAESLKHAATKSGRTMDLVEFALSLGSPQLTEYEPTMGWHSDPVSPKQREMLERAGLDPDRVSGKGQASAIIDKLILRRKLGLATAKQVRQLMRLHHPSPHRATFTEASLFIGRNLSLRRG